MEALSQLFEVLKEAWYDIICWYILPQTQKGIIFRNGIYLKDAEQGLHYKRPCIFGIGDQLSACDYITETTETDPQTLTTKDDKEIVISAIIKHKVSDVKIYLTEVMDVKSAIVDVTMGKIKRNVTSRDWQECVDPSLDNEITKQARQEAKKWGVYIEEVTVINLAKIKSYRIIGSSVFN
jgi:regulator of protease activity HflC (stomatin/prohibitin superfamily)